MTTCSCTVSSDYWSSSTYTSIQFTAWGVNFFGGSVAAIGKANPGYVRAVRGGS